MGALTCCVGKTLSRESVKWLGGKEGTDECRGNKQNDNGRTRPLWLPGEKREVFIRREGSLGDHRDHELRN